MPEMIPRSEQQLRVDAALNRVTIPPGIIVRSWEDDDLTAVHELAKQERWTTLEHRPMDARRGWHHSWPALVATNGDKPVGFLRALTDGEMTTYVAEIVIAATWRGKGVGKALVEVCRELCPSTRLDLLSTGAADGFYEALGFRRVQGFRKSAG